MEKRLAFVLMLAIVLFSGSVATVLAYQKTASLTDKEIIERLTRLEEGQKALNKRIEDLNKRIGDVEHHLNKRIDDLDKKLSARIDDVECSLNKRIDDLRVEMNDRFNTLQWMLGLFISISLIMLGFVLRMQWQMQKRQTQVETTLKTQQDEIAFLKQLIEKLLPPAGVL